MLTQCTECGGQISDKANRCPHCGYPIANVRRVEEVKRITHAAKESVVSNTPRVLNGTKNLTRFIGKALVLCAVILIISLLFNIVNATARAINSYGTSWFAIRMVFNIVMPFTWVIIFITVKKLFGRKALVATLWISILLIPFVLFIETGALLHAKRVIDLSTKEFFWAFFAKTISILCVIGIGFDEIRQFKQDELYKNKDVQ